MSFSSASFSSRLTLSLCDEQLYKLTSDKLEIRMRALEHVEARFMRCLQHHEIIRFKPVLLTKQLIRWFAFSPPAAAMRVLSLMLELLRSEYGDAVWRKIPCQRLLGELEKIRIIVGPLEPTRTIEILDNVKNLVTDIQNPNTPREGSSNRNSNGSGAMESYSADNFGLGPDDYEPAWSQASPEDMTTMQTIVDALTTDSDVQIIEHLINLKIKLSDYPVEYLLQPPNIFLHLLYVQHFQDGDVLMHINRVLLVAVQLMQRTFSIRSKVVSPSIGLVSQNNAPQQLRVVSAMTLLLRGCFEMLGPPLIEHCAYNWHIVDLILEVVKTFGLMGAIIPEEIVERLVMIVPKLISYCNKFDNTDSIEITQMANKLMIPRLESLIFNGLLLDVVCLNASNNVSMDRLKARKQLHSLVLDFTYLSCVPLRMQQMCNLFKMLGNDIALEDQQVMRLKFAYSLALNQFVEETILPPQELLHAHRELGLVLCQFGSKTLLTLLCQAIIKCTSFYGEMPELRKEAEALLSALFDLPDEELHSCALRLLKKPVVDHFHAFMNKSTYLPGCSNIVLAKQHILGLPLSTKLLRKLLMRSWQTENLQMQEWSIDLLIMLLGLAKLIDSQDFYEIFKIVKPVIPLIVCRAVNSPFLEHLLWELFDPDGDYLEPPTALRGNVCYLFHPDAKLRKDAIARIAYLLVWQDNQQKYRPSMDNFCLDLIAQDVCIINPPLNYYHVFSERTSAPFMRNLHTLLRLLETHDLKPGIRKSTLRQLNVLLHNWHAVDAFTTCEGAYVICLKAMHDPLLRERKAGVDESDTLVPAISILLRVLFRNERFRHEFKDNPEMLICLLRCLFLQPHDAQVRSEVAVCIFQLLFHDHMTPTDRILKIDTDLSALHVPVTYEVDDKVPPTAVSEGLSLQDHLLITHFGGDELIASQHWRLYVAHKVCGQPEAMSLSAMREMDIRQSLKLKPGDLALVQATLIPLQLQNQLIEAANSTSHEMMHEFVSSIQMFLVFLRSDVTDTSGYMWSLLHRYLRLTPGNAADQKLYIALLELCLTCLCHRLSEVLNGLDHDLETDQHHSFFVILRNPKVPLHLMYLTSQCLVQLVSWQNPQKKKSSWHLKVFKEISALTRPHFELRNLQHVRCILSILRQLSEQPLELDDSQLQVYYQHFVQLSSNLKTSTQAGAQWQRDCLVIICQLHGQMVQQPAINCKLSSYSKVMRYLLGLCGHSDGEVRCLAWVSMAQWIKSSANNVVSILLELHDFVPGGLAACCLSTMIDAHEDMLARELAGRVFELLMPHIGATACSELFRYHSFLNQAQEALAALHQGLKSYNKDVNETACPTGVQNSCEIMACYVSLCTNMVILQPSWCGELCDHAFTNGLSDIMKLRTPDKPYSHGYLELCAGQICRLYALCYHYNFAFLQRSICRDPVLLKRYFSLMSDVLDQKMVAENQLVQMLKLLMVFCKDQNAYDYLCESFREHPESLFDLLVYGLKQTLLPSALQRHTLSAFYMLLIKTQGAKKEHNLLRVFEAYVEETLSSDEEEDEQAESSSDSEEKENNTNALNKKLNTLSLNPESKPKSGTGTKQTASGSKKKEFTNAAVLLYHSLDQLFIQLYPLKTYNFLQTPSKTHVNVCDVLANLMKQSPHVADEARKFMLLDRVVKLLERFLDDGGVGNATVYVRRVGAHKSKDIINNLLILINMLMHWHNSPHAVITDPVMAARLVHMLLRLWPWLSHSFVLKHMTVRLASMLTEYSFEMCKQSSQVLSCQSHSLLQLMVRVADHETTKREAPSTKCVHAKISSDSIIEAALGVMINCCSCAEGRLSLNKMRVLDMFDTILPASQGTGTKVKPEVILSWLTFWEVFSRYEMGHKLCHMPALLNAVRRSPPLSNMRMCCLRILRNMCFCSGNRMPLVNMTEFLDLLRDILSQPMHHGNKGGGDPIIVSYEEQFIATLCLWKLFGFSAKCKGMLRGTTLETQLSILLDELSLIELKRPEYAKTLLFASQLKRMITNVFEALEQ